MKYANTIQEVLSSMTTEPLKKNELEEFYVDTIQVRTNSPFISPMEDIIVSFQAPSEHNSFLLLGHKGCGKSTELTDMSEKLTKKGFPVHSVSCGKDLDLIHMSYEDLLILMGDSLLTIVQEKNISIDPALLEEIQNFWRVETEEERAEIKEYGLDNFLGFGAAAGIPGLLKALLNIKGSIRWGDTTKVVYRKKIARCSSQWLRLLQKIVAQITLHEGHQPVLIFEDLDKIDKDTAWNVFSSHAFKLSGLSCPVVFTFPIALSYSPKFSDLTTFFSYRTLPMIEIVMPDGQPFEKGYAQIRQIIKRRMDADTIFEDNVLDHLIEKTGGSLRDLFHSIIDCAMYADRMGQSTISMEFADAALMQIKSDLTRRIERRNYDFLSAIYTGNRTKIENTDMLLEMLQAGVVLEYNSTRWHNVHPLIGDFLHEEHLDEEYLEKQTKRRNQV